MYQVKCDGEILHDPRLEDRKIFNANLELELCKTGTFTFEVYPSNPCFEKMIKRRSVIEVIKGGDVVFRGQILNDEQGFYKNKQVTCEGELAYWLDSLLPPIGDKEKPKKRAALIWLTLLAGDHGEIMGDCEWKKIPYSNADWGECKDEEIAHYTSDYKTTFDVISEVLSKAGANFWLEYENGQAKLCIKKQSEMQAVCEQPIELGKNLLDYKKTSKSEDFCTGIIPLYKDDNGELMTISSVNGGVDYLINEETAAIYGRIFKTVIFDDVGNPAELKEAGKQYLANETSFTVTIELTAADLSGITECEHFKLGRKILVKDTKHEYGTAGETVDFVVKKLSIPILNPANSRLTVGATFGTMTEAANSTSSKQSSINASVDEIKKNASGYATKTDIEGINSSIETLGGTVTEQGASVVALTERVTLGETGIAELKAIINAQSAVIEDLKTRVETLEG